jgi:small-conductance mechanosensitive channel
MKDSVAFKLTRETTMKPLEKETIQKKISTWSILMLSIVLIGLSFLFVEWKAPKVAGRKIGAGLGEIPVLRIILILIILTGCIMYILKPLVENYGFGWLTAGVCILLLMLLYRLFAKGLTIFNDNNKK